jgi:hypothetical protein
VSVVGGFAGQLAGAALRGQLLADAASATMARVAIAELASAGTGILVDSAVNAAGATALTGESGGDALLTNFLSAGAIRATLGPLHQLAATWNVSALEGEALSLWTRSARAGGLVLAKTSLLTAEMITAAAVAHVVHRVRHDKVPDAQTLQDWALAGASQVIGAWVGRSMAGLHQRAAHYVEAGPHLARRARALQEQAELVARAPDKDAAMQLLVERHALLREEQALLRSGAFDVRLPATTVEVLRAGNQHELAATAARGMDTLPLRLSGLAPEDASGRVWAGSSEEITIALHQAQQVGLSVEVLAIEGTGAARRWRVALAHRELTLHELPRQGRTRAAVAAEHVDERVVHQARRYAAAARALRPEVEAATRRLVEAGPDFATETLQIGHGFGGVMNQDTRAPGGAVGDARVHLIVYTSDGAMTQRGELPSGQAPALQTMPGVRTREHALDQEAFTPSHALGDATEVGRWEMQTPAYRGQVARLERRPAEVPADWTHPDRRLRVDVVGPDGERRWVYANHVDNLGGMGPPALAPIRSALGGGAAGEAALARLLASGRLLGGSDPHISAHLRAGERVAVLGGSPTGAWAGEDAARHGAHVTILGEAPPSGTRDAVAPPVAEAELMQLLRRGDAGEIAAFLQRRTEQTHSGSGLRRNQQPGTAYAPAAQRPDNLAVELGVPTRIRQLDDGRVEVTLGIGEAHARAQVAAEGVAVQGETGTVRIYDRVIVAYGQDPGAPGGPGALLGKGAPSAPRVEGQLPPEVPRETIALRMILEREDGSLVGLESLDGSVRLLGAAYASAALAPWVVAAERDAFVQKVTTPTGRTHTGETISDDSPKWGAVIEVQRDKLPVANEIHAARRYQLGEGNGEVLRLPAERPEAWRGELERFLTRGMHAGAGRVTARLLERGRDGVHTFRVHNGAEEVGLVRVYDSMAAVEVDAQLRALVARSVPTLEPELARGAVQTGEGKVAELSSHGAEADARQGRTLASLVEQWAAMPEQTEAQREIKKRAFGNTVGAAVKRTAETLAALHATFSSGELMSPAAKEREIAAVHAALASPQVARALGGAAEVAKVRAALAPLEARFRAAPLPRTVELGDASAAALRFKDYKRDELATAHARQQDANAEVMMFGKMSAEDVAGVGATLDGSTRKGTGTGAADVADFLASLREMPELAGTLGAVEKLLFDTYARASGVSRSDIAGATRWYEASAAIRGVAHGQTADLERLNSFSGDAAQ